MIISDTMADYYFFEMNGFECGGEGICAFLYNVLVFDGLNSLLALGTIINYPELT
jgi:hypothetical protein